MAENVRCMDCGYLAIRNFQTRQLMEVELGVRGEWSLPEHEEGFGSASQRRPVYVFKYGGGVWNRHSTVSGSQSTSCH